MAHVHMHAWICMEIGNDVLIHSLLTMRMKMQQKTLVVPGNCTVVCARWDILDQQ